MTARRPWAAAPRTGLFSAGLPNLPESVWWEGSIGPGTLGLGTSPPCSRVTCYRHSTSFVSANRTLRLLPAASWLRPRPATWPGARPSSCFAVNVQVGLLAPSSICRLRPCSHGHAHPRDWAGPQRRWAAGQAEVPSALQLHGDGRRAPPAAPGTRVGSCLLEEPVPCSALEGRGAEPAPRQQEPGSRGAGTGATRLLLALPATGFPPQASISAVPVSPASVTAAACASLALARGHGYPACA